MTMIKNLWLNVPKTLQVSTITALILAVIASIAACIFKNIFFGLQTGITGIISVALLCVYVVYVAKTMADAKSAMTPETSETLAVSVANRIQVASLVKLFILAGIIVTLVVAFKFDVIAVAIGVSAMYLPLLVVPFFVKSTDNGAESNRSEGV
jgi:hypothetical protein